MARRTTPLNPNLPMVDPKSGTPSPFFLRWWQDQVETNRAVTPLSSAAQVTEVLDVLDPGAEHGDILYRGINGSGAARWFMLSPGATGQVLTTAGPDADPVWADAIPTEAIIVACSDETTDLAPAAPVVSFRMPYAFTLSEVRASVNTAATGATLQITISEDGVPILSTDLTIDAGETSSVTAAVSAVISDADLANDARIDINLVTVGATIAGAGLKVTFIGEQA